MILLEQLAEIHKKVFKNFTYKTDKAQYKIDEKWVQPSKEYDGTSKIVGDCEDFALACRKLCRDAGLKTRLVFCEVGNEGGHVVLECQGWILDNRFNGVKTKDYLERNQKYKWVMISGYEPEEPWSYVK